MDDRAQAVLDRIYRDDAAQRAANLPPAQRTRNLTRESGRFLNLLATSLGARAVVEIGSSNGASTIWLADAMRAAGGKVIGTEIIPERVDLANANLREAGLWAYGEVRAGDARHLIQQVEGPIDLVFIDAEKEDYVAHFEAVIGLVRPGGVVLADNVTSYDISAYQTMVRRRDDVESVTLTLERGIEYTVKRLPNTDRPARAIERERSP